VYVKIVYMAEAKEVYGTHFLELFLDFPVHQLVLLADFDPLWSRHTGTHD